ncbi:lipopolysaccharide biosynthesis protein [Methanobacterium sp. CWC-01]|uniref:lipopolysaccharide biosynthesis protein n=1 Tax=Methanobacterium aridiramus TaxID=2584467 RepID=UPI0025774851|nr:oligosaccharide flippase family protein [Methanobacterium sp. CWC-01]
MKLVNSYKNAIKPFSKAIGDVIISSIPQIVAIVVGLLTTSLIARGLGPSGMGIFALVISFSTLIIGLSDLGIGQTTIRFASKAATRDDKVGFFGVLRWAFRLRLVLILILSTLFYALAPLISTNFWHDESLTYYLRLSLLIGIFSVISHIPYVYFQSLKRFRANAILSTLQTVVIFIGILIIALLNNWSLQLVIGVNILASIINASSFALSVPKSTFIDPSNSFIKTLKQFWKAPNLKNISESSESYNIYSFTFFMVISSLAVMITMQADIWLMGYYLEPNQVGIYSVAKYFTVPLTVLIAAVNTALWPRASELMKTHESVEMLRITFKFSILASTFGLLYSFIVPFTTPWIFGEAYNGGIIIGILLCVRYCIAILICPLGIIGYNFDMVYVYWWVNIIQLLIVIGISIMLLPSIGPIGSAIALIANEIVGSLIMGLLLWRKIKIYT